MPVSLSTSTADAAFRAACDHRHALVNEIDARDLDALVPGWRDRYAAYYAALFARGDGALVSFAIGDEIAGSCIVSVLDDFRRSVVGRGTAYINAMFVVEPKRGRAIASQLLDASTAWAKAHGCTTVRLHPSPVSRDFYRKRGFAPIDEYELRIP